MDPSLDLLVRQGDPRGWRFVDGPAPDPGALPAGELLVRVETFGLSANNVTYAVLGKSDIINYFDFFPTDEPGWGRVPVWGMGVVTASQQPALAAGERMYGYFPLARYARLRPARATSLGFDVDRGHLPAVYNQYTLTRTDPLYLPAREEAMIVFRPLVLTGILLDDFIAEGNDWFGARSVLVASASSKTSAGLAFMLSRRRSGCAVVGLTSARHVRFVEALGLYSSVVPYAAVGDLPRDATAVFVDVAGDAGVRDAVRARLGSNLKATITVGLSHWDRARGAAAAEASNAGEPTVFFFAPAWVEKRRSDWGPAAFGERIASAWRDFMGDVDRWARIVRGEGRETVGAVYARMVDGECGPEEAYVLSLWDGAFGTASEGAGR